MLETASLQHWGKTLVALSCAAFLSACGGGGGDKTSTPASEVNVSSSSSLSSTTVSSGSSSLGVHLMGGAIQGSPLNISGVVTTLAGAAEGADGTGMEARFNEPHGITSDGTNLYVADTYNHKIRKIVMATGMVTSLTTSIYTPKSITSDGTNLYVTDSNNKVRKIVIATGEVSTLLSNGSFGSADSIGAAMNFNQLAGITNDGLNLYIADNYKIHKIVIATGIVTTLAGSISYGSADGTGAGASFSDIAAMISDGANLYVADRGNWTIRKIVIATGEVTTLAGSGSIGSADGTGTAASFYHLHGITSDGTHLYVIDNGNNKIRKIAIATGEVITLAGSGLYGSADGTSAAASFSSPQGITNDGANLYVADTINHKIRKIVIATGVVSTLAGSGLDVSADGIRMAARFAAPFGVTSDGTNLYVADTWNHKIRKITIATGEVITLAGSGSYGSVDGAGTAASFHCPQGISNDGKNLYVADTCNHKIRKIVVATGAVTTLAGSGSQGSADGTGTIASFYSPSDITSDGTNLYVADTSNNTIRKVVMATGVVTTLAGSGSPGSADGQGPAASFFIPSGITSDGTNLYVADSGNHRVRKIVTETGVVTTLAGSGYYVYGYGYGYGYGREDGTGTAASFYYPSGITSDGTNLYVADTYNNTIRKIVIATGVVTTLVGSGSKGSADGVGSAASFYAPSGITSNGYELFVTDTNNSTIRKIH